MDLLNLTAEASVDNGLVFCFPDFAEKVQTGWTFCFLYIIAVLLAIIFGFYVRIRKCKLSIIRRWTQKQSRRY
jgi:hypothetical protein